MCIFWLIYRFSLFFSSITFVPSNSTKFGFNKKTLLDVSSSLACGQTDWFHLSSISLFQVNEQTSEERGWIFRKDTKQRRGVCYPVWMEQRPTERRGSLKWNLANPEYLSAAFSAVITGMLLAAPIVPSGNILSQPGCSDLEICFHHF